MEVEAWGWKRCQKKKIQKGAVGQGGNWTNTQSLNYVQIKAPSVLRSKASPLVCLSPLGAPPPSLATLPAKCPRCETETLRGGPQGPVSAALCNPELWLSSCPFGWLLDILGLYMPLTPSAAGERLLLLVISKTGLVSALDLTADGCA